MQQNNGFIKVYSKPMAGSTFQLYFPRYKETPGPKIAPEIEKIPQGAGETVLVVEDNQMLLSMTEKMLAHLGYRPLPAAGPAEALKIAAAHKDNINLVLTDVIMPEMNGRELSQKLQAHSPDIRVLFMSGYPADVIAHHGILEDGVVFIQKPFSKNELAQKVRETLDMAA